MKQPSEPTPLHFNCDLRLLRCFVAVAEEGHFGRAAKRLGMSQPPLSVAIADLEARLGAPLIRRGRRVEGLTPVGASLLPRARAILCELSIFERTAAAHVHGLAGMLRIGFVGVATALGVPTFVRGLREALPNLQLELSEVPSDPLVERVRARGVDLGFVRSTTGRAPAGLAGQLFRRDRYAVAIPLRHRLARQSTLTLADLDDQPLLFFPRTLLPALYDAWLATFARAGVRPRLGQEIQTVQTEQALVACGMALALVPASFGRERRSDVVVRPLTGDTPPVELWAVWPPEAANPALMRALRHLPSASRPMQK